MKRSFSYITLSLLYEVSLPFVKVPHGENLFGAEGTEENIDKSNLKSFSLFYSVSS